MDLVMQAFIFALFRMYAHLFSMGTLVVTGLVITTGMVVAAILTWDKKKSYKKP